MRHLFSILASLIIAPVTWLLVGFGQAKLVKASADSEGFTLGDASVPLALLAGAGLVYGLIAVTRISPLGAVLGALFFAGGQLAYAWRPMKFTDVLPQKVFGETGVLTLPASTGVAAILGGALLLSLFSVGRWRRWPRYDEPEDLYERDAGQVGAPTPAGARQPFDDPMGPPPGSPIGSPVGGPAEPTRAFAGSPAAEPPRYEPFGYVSDEPGRSGPAWSDAPEPPWHGGERPTRLRGAGDVMGPSDPGAGGPWLEPPRHR
ncbi:MAG: hypothetical protein GEU94_14615 [Micromonosporaceae bacterium]|nr:hypothetical protein [Micromonosporaceae bacterium]